MSAINHLISKGVPPDCFQFSRANRRLMFGGDGSLVADWSVHLPVFVHGTPGRIQAFIVLIGRPVLKALQVKTDFERDLCSVLGSDYGSAFSGPGGEFLLQLEDGVDPATFFDWVTEESSENSLSFSIEVRPDVKEPSEPTDTDSNLLPAHFVPTAPSIMKALDISVRQAANAVHGHIEEALWKSTRVARLVYLGIP